MSQTPFPSNFTFKDSGHKKAFLDAMKEMCEELDKVQEANDQFKEIVIATAEAFEIPKQLITKVVKLYHKREAQKFAEQTSAVTELYEEITRP